MISDIPVSMNTSYLSLVFIFKCQLKCYSIETWLLVDFHPLLLLVIFLLLLLVNNKNKTKGKITHVHAGQKVKDHFDSVITNSPGDWGSIPGQDIPKTQKKGT